MQFEYMQQVDTDALDDLVARRLVNVQQHPTLPLWIYNYSQDAQLMWGWKYYPLLRFCRGLVLNDQKCVIAQGFRKFFNYGDNTDPEPNTGGFRKVLTEKLDGSMVLVFSFDGQLVTATRGSFTSEQAVAALPLYQQYAAEVLPDVTLIFELIGPNNRHVVDYPLDELVLIGMIGRSGKDYAREILVQEGQTFGFPVVEQHYFDLSEVSSQDDTNREGFIYSLELNNEVVWRSKIKFDTYLAAHRVVFGGSWKDAVYDAWANNETSNLINLLPEYYANLAKEYIVDLDYRQQTITKQVADVLSTLSGDPTNRADRAHMAQVINRLSDAELRTACYQKLSNKTYRIKAV